ncbi:MULTISPECIES: outer membrane beta-barrel protein [Deefgea]|uniref:Outer membrane beta-barrel protein n=1 Tax=Deefgea chitinilytica TaxID=570276 RepID=A0ABS2CDX4_9NEIS|nr:MULTISPECIES: outer membrane beta-barrel protein [Deefgea]MBM5572338.1 outer membrane beta-barrel protein [Deefgea chitinilytica]MBM9889574.1 outer membrane beta-barrel protein [Deefgea sp. CFH1-16]
MLRKNLVLLSALALGNAQAAYDSEDTVKLFADLAYVYDSNVFRLSDKQENNSTRRHQQKSDSSITAGFGGRVDLPLSRQNVYATANVSYRNYQVFDELNGPAWDVGLGWNWVVGNQWSGTLTASTSSELSSFDDVRVSVVDTVKKDRFTWSANYQLLSNWALLANARYIQEDHDVRKYQNANDRLLGGGVRYTSDRGFSVTLLHSWSEHNYEEDLIIPAHLRGYREQDTSLALSWPVTEKFNANLNIGYNQWTSDFNSTKSTKPTGSLDLLWKVTPKTTLSAGAGQNFDSFGSNFVGRDLERTAYVKADWAITDKSKLAALYKYRQLETQLASGRITQDSEYDMFRLSFDYKILRSMLIRSFVEFGSRDEKINQFDYTDEQVGVSVKYDF